MVPEAVADVDALLQWLGMRKRGAAARFTPGRVRVPLNQQFTEGFTRLHDSDEIGLAPTSPTTPATPDLT